MEATYCANEECRFHAERKGGRFIYRGGLAYCEDCAKISYQMNDGKNLYEFTTTHMTDPSKPIEVTSKGHLRRLEKDFGVIHVQANFNERNWEPPKTVRDPQSFRRRVYAER
jgi:hypothetical protein